MCDYSLHQVATRPARVGDALVTTRFQNSITRGFSAAGEPNVAICLQPGTEIVFAKDCKHRNVLAMLLAKLGASKLSGKVARFRQINLDKPCAHHDALEFADGKVVLLTSLHSGHRARVLQLPAKPFPLRVQEPNDHEGMSYGEHLRLV